MKRRLANTMLAAAIASSLIICGCTKSVDTTTQDVTTISNETENLDAIVSDAEETNEVAIEAVEDVKKEPAEPIIEEEYDEEQLLVVAFPGFLWERDNTGSKSVRGIERGNLLYIIGRTSNNFYLTNEGYYVDANKMLTREEFEEAYYKIYIFNELEEETTMYAQVNASIMSNTKEDADTVATANKGDEITVVAISDDGTYYMLADGNVINASSVGNSKPQTQTQSPSQTTSEPGALVADASQSPAYSTTTVTTPSNNSSSGDDWWMSNWDNAPTYVTGGGGSGNSSGGGSTTTVVTGPDTVNGVYTYNCYLVTGMTSEINTRRTANGVGTVYWESSWETEILQRARELAPSNGQGMWDNVNHQSSIKTVTESIAGGFWQGNASQIDQQYANSELHNAALHRENITRICSATCDVYIDGVYYASYNVTYQD